MRKLHLSILLLVPLLSWGDNIVPTEIGAEPFMADFKWGQMTDTGYLEPQDKPCFNYYTPAQTNCGCVATALAQVMRYWRWPSTNVCVAAEEYLCGFEGTGVTCRVESWAFGWDKMPLNPAGAGEAERQEIGHLTFDIAASVGSLFAVPEGGTIASMVTAYLRLKDRYYFSSCEGVEFVEGYPYDEEVLKQMIIPSCDYGSPVVLSVMSGEFRHEIVVDGYGYEGTNFVVHALTGGNGADDGWFRPPYFFSGGHVFSEVCGGLYNILPKQTGTIISGRVRGVNGDPVGNVTVTLVDSTGASWTTRTKDSDGGRGSYAFLVPHPGVCTLIATAEGLVGSNKVEVVANASPQVDVKTGAFYPSFRPTIGNTYGNDIRLQPLPGVAVETVPTPVIDGTGTYSRVARVSIRCADEKATVRYTTDGSEPNWASPAYEGPFDVCDSQPVTVKAKAWRDGFYASSVASGSCMADESCQVGDDCGSPILISGTNGVRTVAFLAKYGLEDWETNEYPHVIQQCSDKSSRWFYYYHSVWFRWTAPATGSVKFFASNSSTNVYGAFVSVYEDGGKIPSKRLGYSVGELAIWPDGADEPTDFGLPYDTPTVEGIYATGYSSGVLPEDCDYHDQSGWGCDQIMGYDCYLNYTTVEVTAGKTYRIVVMAPYDYHDQWIEDSASAFFYLKWKGNLETSVPDHGPEPGPHPTDRHFLTLNAGGGVLEDAVRLVSAGTFVNLPKTLGRDGYEFGGWYTNAADGAEADVSAGLSVNASVTVHARWRAKAYAISYRDVAEDGPTSYTIEDLIVLAEPKPPADKPDVHFLGWSPSGMIPVGSTGDKSFVANWEHDTVTIRFDAGGGSVDEQVRTIKKNAPCGVLPSPSRVGYVFKGWFTAEEGGSPVSDETTVGADCTYFAQWEIDRFKITYDLDGGVNHPDNPSTYTMEDSVRLKSPTREGWGFAGWEPSDGIARLSLGDRSFTAVWRTSLFHIAFAANGGSGVMSNLVVEVGTTNRLPRCTFTNERTFLGWSTNATGAVVYEDGAEFYTAADVPDGSLTTLYAIWQNIPTEFGPYVPGVRYVIPVPDAAGFKVSGLPSGFKWTETDTGDVRAYSIYGASTKPGTNTVTFTRGDERRTAKFIVGPLPKVTVNVEDASRGSVKGAGAFVADKKVTLKATAARDSVFNGWYDANSNCLSQAASYPYTVPTNDVVLTARFIAASSDFVRVTCQTGGVAVAELSVRTKAALESPVAVVAESGSLVKFKVTGLPSGLKFTANDILKKGSKDMVEVPANTIYGTPTKSGIFMVSVVATTASKKSDSKVVKFIVRATGETMVDADCDWTSGKVSGMGACPSGKSRTLKATAAKNYVFAGWYLDRDHMQPAKGAVDYRSPSFAVADNGTDQKFYARFVPTAEDKEVKALVEACYTLNGPWTNKLYVESLSLPSVKVKGLPSGLKFDAKALKFSGTPTKPGSYTVTLTLKNATVKKAVTQTFELDVANIECPYLVDVDYDRDAYVYRSGVGVDWDVGACARDDYSVTGVTGLPKGLKFNSKSGKIEGVPSKAGPFTVTIKLKNGSKTSLATVSMKVDAIDDWAFGSFNGGSECGQVQMTVSKVGKLSGKYLADGIVYTLSAPSYSSYDKETGRYLADVKASWSYKNGGKTVKTNDVIKVAVSAGDVGGRVTSDCFKAWQDNWKLTKWKAIGLQQFGAGGRTETYAVLSDRSFSTSPDDLATSLGDSVFGKVTLTYSPKGTVKTAGEFVTGFDDKKGRFVTVKTTGSAAVCATSDDPFAARVFVYFAPNASKSFDGHVRIVQLAE